MPSTARPSPWVQDLAVALVVGTAWFTVITVMDGGDYWHPRSIGAYHWAGAWIVATLALRRVAPGRLFWVTAFVYPLWQPAPLQSYFLLLPVVVTSFAVTRAGAAPPVLAGVAAGLSGGSLLVGGRSPLPGEGLVGPLWFTRSPSEVLVVEALVLGAVAAGVVFRRLAVTSDTLRERNAELQALQAELARRAVQAERTRIARELHDVVAHHMSAIVVRAQAADRVAANRPTAPAEAVAWIADEGKEALAAMRSVVQVLRTDGDAGPELSPAAAGGGVDAAVREAVRRATEAGRAVELTLAEPRGPVRPEVELAVVRIVQESLANVLLHSLAHQVTVTVEDVADDLEVTVRDAGPPLPDDPSRPGGHGLRSMRERARSCGGTLVAGPDERGGWVVRARLPRAAAPRTAPTGGQG